MRLHKILVFVAALLAASCAWADERQQNHFASVLLEGKKIGHVQYTVTYDKAGQVEEIHTRASYSILGIKLYDLTQHFHEQWSSGELQKMWGTSNENGTINAVTVDRTKTEYKATLNKQPKVLPHDAFPLSLWHFAITKQSLLFHTEDLRLLKVKVAERAEKIKWHGKTITAKRFDFTGEWKGTVWYDSQETFLKAKYESSNHLVGVVMDPVE
jgi:hypothetical protein